MKDPQGTYLLDLVHCPMRKRLRKGARLLDPTTGSYNKAGGLWVNYVRPTEDGKCIVRCRGVYHLVEPAALGLLYSPPVQQPLFKERF